MKNLVGSITASLIEKEPSGYRELTDIINRNIKPPTAVHPDNVHIRAMYIVSDQVNSYGGCFPGEEHEKLAEMLIDSPVLIGHRKDSLPIARNFHAETVIRDGVRWVKVYFYWLKNADRSDDLCRNIDGGIYKEGSISFIFNFPECSICGEDIRKCRHRPFEEYDVPGGDRRQAYFNYRQILKVLETSLVYRGSVEDTTITNELVFRKVTSDESPNSWIIPLYQPPQRIWSMERLNKSKKYHILPAYESLPVTLCRFDGRMRILGGDQIELESDILNKYLESLPMPDNNFAVEARLIGHRGKERRPVEELIRFLQGEKTNVRRIELKICDLLKAGASEDRRVGGSERREELNRLFAAAPDLLVPARVATGDNLAGAIWETATRYGVEIHTLDSDEKYLLTHRHLIRLRITGQERRGNGFDYSLEGRNRDNTKVVTHLRCNRDFRVGDVIEIETASITDRPDGLHLMHPRVIDCHFAYGIADDLSQLVKNDEPANYAGRYHLSRVSETTIRLDLEFENGVRSYNIKKFNTDRLEEGRRFPADEGQPDKIDEGAFFETGNILDYTTQDNALKISLDGFLGGKYIIRPIILNGHRRHLFYQFSGGKNV
nr:hypothetical protein [candidate division Zixibacteria bacterium]